MGHYEKEAQNIKPTIQYLLSIFNDPKPLLQFPLLN